jgi:hypothetical protein
VDAAAIVGQIGGGGAGCDGRIGDAHDGGAAIEAVRGAGEDPQTHRAAGEPHGLQMSLHLLERAPLVAIAHQHADARRADAWMEELVAAPGIGGEHGRQSASASDDGVGEAARRRRQHGRAAAAVALCADARGIDLRDLREHLPGGEHVIGTCREGVLRLVRHRRRDAPRAEGIEDEGGQARAGERLGMREMHGRHAQATRHDDDEGQSGRGRRAGRKEELAVDRDSGHLGRCRDGLVIVAR